MRTTRLAVLLSVFALSLSGCLKAEDTIVIKKDGSGTITASYAVDIPKAEELAQAAAMMFGTGSDSGEPLKINDRNPLHPSWFQHDAKDVEGYDVKEAGQSTNENAKTITTSIKGAFTSLAAAAKANAFFSGVTLSRVEKSETVPNGAWKLSFKNVFTGEAMGMPMADVLPMFEGQLKILNMARKLTLPTKILSTNGKKSEDGKSVEWNITYDKILEGKDLTMTVTFEAAEDLKLKPFTFSPDLQALSRRAMEKPPGAKTKTEKGDGDADD